MSLLCVLTLLSLPCGFFAIAPGIASGSVLLLLFVTLGLAVSTMTLTLSIVVMPNELRGLCIALYTVAGALFGVGLAPLTVSLLAGALGGPAAVGRALAWVGGSTAALGALLFALGRRYLAGDERLVHTARG